MALSEPTSPFTGPSEPSEGRLWHRLSRWISREENTGTSHGQDGQDKPSLGRRLSRRVVPGLPRQTTFKRQISERRDRLEPVNQPDERRAQSLDRRRVRTLVPPSSAGYDVVGYPDILDQHHEEQEPITPTNVPAMDLNQTQMRPMPPDTPPADHEFPHVPGLDDQHSPGGRAPAATIEQLNKELEEKWILNLSMHFRDNSPREKLFITYAETPTKWRRLTVSCDYRDAPPDSLESDLQGITYQRDKNARIYDAIRNSLPDIQFFNTVTNLRLKTDSNDQLHVHVTEDVNEIIPFPTTTAVKHLDCLQVREQDVIFDSHMSGFVYKVRVDNEAFENKIVVKKEIPGPDSVEEFLYEINALHALIGTSNVVQFEGLVINEEYDLVTGLLISYANQGPLVDLIYDFKGTGSLSWERKDKWARQMIYGVSAIHEAGFVQGDCTLSNVVIDEYDDALIIDINRRGCPVGWEPPEIHSMIDNGHRISMYIGVKSDLFQLGMSLWALLMEEDEPERQTRPLRFESSFNVPSDKRYLVEVAKICLSDNPRDRLSAEKLLSFFPPEKSGEEALLPPAELLTSLPTTALPTGRETVYVGPSTAVEEVVTRNRAHHFRGRSDDSLARSTSTNSEEDRRGRTPPRGGHLPERRLTRESFTKDETEPLIVSISPGREPRFEGNFYGMDIDEDDEEAIQRVLRRRHRIRSLGSAAQDKSNEDDYGDVLRRLDHVDSGLGPGMQVDTTSPVQQLMLGLDHVDSGLADMDIGYIDSNDLARRKTNSIEFNKDFAPGTPLATLRNINNVNDNIEHHGSDAR